MMSPVFLLNKIAIPGMYNPLYANDGMYEGNAGMYNYSSSCCSGLYVIPPSTSGTWNIIAGHYFMML